MANLTEFFVDRKLNLNLFKFAYPEVIGTLKRLGGSLEFVEQQLLILGRRVGDYVGENWQKKYKNLNDIVKEISELSGSKKIIIKRDKDSFFVTDKDCFVCWSAVEVTNIHYCIIISGFIDGFFAQFSKKSDFPYHLTMSKTINSRSSGDKFCRHEIHFIRK